MTLLFIDIGPKAGRDGGICLFSGVPSEVLHCDTLTSKWLRMYNSQPVIKPRYNRRKAQLEPFTIRNANSHNLKNVNVDIPRGGVLVCITGVAGSGKSTLIRECFLTKVKTEHVTCYY